MQRFRLADLAARPWKNGGGLTREIACAPEGSDAKSFDWRVSVATIETDGPFSAFDGIDRTIMLLSGPGVRLAASGIAHELTEPLQPFEFPGEAPIECTVLGGASTDFNLMVRRTRGRGSVSVHQSPIHITAAGAVVLAVGGRVHLDGRVDLEAGSGFWWTSPSELGASPEPGASVVLAQWRPAVAEG